MEKQKVWLDANWKKSAFFKKYKTCGYKFKGDPERERLYLFHGKNDVGKDCLACEAFVTFFWDPKLNVLHERACVGEKGCFDRLFADPEDEGTEKSVNDAERGQGDQPRVAGHGEHLWELFFKERIPECFEKLSDRGLASVQHSLFALIKSSGTLRRWFFKSHGGGTSRTPRIIGFRFLMRKFSG